ncbi:hypothetical protein NM208_g957 [Fusarium decemcellulare]|uniref:Uncharacterized protein n=1 Tax=Fusarium decemcellulare TaxID=57161 RepID=A0ACC1SXU2_9HYPO|nr:hypothetical protein NM208_g957 [Fusarium decemcellulare]
MKRPLKKGCLLPQILAVNFNLTTTLILCLQSTLSSTTTLAFAIRSADNDVPTDRNGFVINCNSHKARGRDQHHKLRASPMELDDIATADKVIYLVKFYCLVLLVKAGADFSKIEAILKEINLLKGLKGREE